MKVPCLPRHSLFRFQVLRENAMNNYSQALVNIINVDDNNIKRVSYYYHFLFVIFLIIFSDHGTSSAATDSDALLQLKKSFTNASALVSWKPNTDACDIINRWKGVVCNHQGRVANLNLGDFHLSGTIDMDALVNISELRGLSVMYNHFSGLIPDFNRLANLKSLYLVGNKFSGEIPTDYFKKMVSLKKIWLSENHFTGSIPSSLTRLSLLTELHLENNQFSGEIPEFRQPRLNSFNVSYNNLTGEVPQILFSFNPSSFKGNPGLCGSKVGKPCNVFHDDHRIDKKDDSFNTYFYMLIIISAVVLALMSLGILVLYHRQKRESDVKKMANAAGGPNRLTSLRDLTPSKKRFGSSRKGSSRGKKGSTQDLIMINSNTKYGEFSLTELMSAAAEVVADGNMGTSYKATMSNDLTVFVKRIKGLDKIGRDGFENHMKRLGRLKHNNIITPLACYYQKDEKLLVNGYIPGGSLLYLLHGDRGASREGLNLATRVKIIKGIAQGLGYLHSELQSSNPHELPHGDLKSNNVFLDSNYNPILTDFGYSFLMNSTQCKQTLFAYKSPEAATKSGVSPKTDVYCLGIIILELFTGKIPSLYLSSGAGGIDIVGWVKSAIAEGKEAEIIDSEIATAVINNISPHNGNIGEKILLIGAACTETDPQQRLDIRDAINRIQDIQVEEDDAKNQELASAEGRAAGSHSTTSEGD